jgi:hypothetical protein
MTAPAIPRNAYTDAPELHPNLVLGSLQLLFWLFFHPSAWRNHVAHIDPKLRPNFCLAELNREQWRNPILQRLLIMGFVIWPLLAGLLMSLVEWLSIDPSHILDFGVGFGVACAVTVSMAVGVASAFGIEAAFVAAFGVLGAASPDTPRTLISVGLAGGVTGVAMLSITGNFAGRSAVYSTLGRQISNAVIGVLSGVVAVGIAYDIAFNILMKPGQEGVRLIVWNQLTGTLPHAIPVGIALGIAVGWSMRSWYRGVVTCAAISAVLVVPEVVAQIIHTDLTDSIAAGMAFGGLSGALFALPYVLTQRMAGPWIGAVAGALGIGVGWAALEIAFEKAPPWATLSLGLISVLLGLTLGWWRPVLLYPFLVVWNLLLYRVDERYTRDHPSLLRWNPAFWDEHQWLPLLGLGEHLVLVMERNPTEGQAAMEYLATGRQRWAAQAAQIELDARRLERCTSVITISRIYRGLAAGELAGPASALLRSFSRISQDVEAALRQGSAYNQRLALSAVEDRLNGLLRELTRSSERYAVRFRPIANRWRQIIADQVHELVRAVELRQEIDSPYIFGVPLTEQQEIFVGRTDVSARIESLLLDRRCPPLLLYGQRRMGKTSLLHNLGRLLPSTIAPLFVDLQGPASQTDDHAGLLYNIARGMVESAEKQRSLILPSLAREVLADDPFTRFDEWLDEVEHALGDNTALLALDEFEALDSAITKGHFDEERVLGMLRHLIQHRPRFKVLLAGSHTLEELQRWSSYLINVQVVQISYLKEAEARQLIERPVKDFALRYEPDACQRVLDLTRCHPALVQLLCAEVVALKNEQDRATRRCAHLEDVEAAVPEALGHGSLFFADIQRNQVDAAGLALLRFLAKQGERAVVDRETSARQLPAPDGLDRTLSLLSQRELIESVAGGYRFQVELIRRWFAESA